MDLDGLLSQFFASLRDVLSAASRARDGEEGVVVRLTQGGRRKTPAQLVEELDLDFGHDSIRSCNYDELFVLLESVMRNSVNTNSPLFLNRLYTGAELAGVLAEYLVVALNTSAGAWDVCPVFSLMEREVINRFLFHVGFVDGCGVFCPGGSLANLYAIHAAREQRLGQGDSLSELVAICGTQAHYSVDKSARMIGLSDSQLVAVASDSHGRIIPLELERTLIELVAAGKKPFFCHLTSGTTVMGAFDELGPLIDVCNNARDVWVHVDASWGGSVLLSEKKKHLMQNVERSDSVAWCAHKMIGAPLHASVVLFRDKNALKNAFDCNTPYIYQYDSLASKEVAQLDLQGKHTFQCSRPADSVKVWFVLRHLGSVGLEKKVNHAFDMAAEFVSLIRNNSNYSRNFRLVYKTPQFANVCFWFLPGKCVELFEKDFEEYDGMLFGPRDPNHLAGEVTARIKGEMVNQGKLLMAYSTLNVISHSFPYFFRFVAIGRQLNVEQLHFILDHIKSVGEELYKQ